MPKLLLSACLAGQKVRYDGNDNLQTHQRLQRLLKAGHVVTICPEVAGGLPTPRQPAEIQGKGTGLTVLEGDAKVITNNGENVTASYVKGAHIALALAQKHKIKVAILKARSPSCGSQQVYDGQFSGKMIPGMGVAAALLSKHGVDVYDEYHIDQALDRLKKNDV